MAAGLAGVLAIVAVTAALWLSSVTKPPRNTSSTTIAGVSGPVTTGVSSTTRPVLSDSVGVQTVTYEGGELPTEILYPALGGTAHDVAAGAAPDRAHGPYPVIVFAHGYDTTPGTYATLLDAWVHAGFVVVAPIFPHTSSTAVTDGTANEGDIGAQPSEVSYVVGQVVAGASTPGSPLDGLVLPDRIGLAGQSDGGETVAGLAYGALFASDYTPISSHVRAVVVLSGGELIGGGPYGRPSGDLPLLVSQSNADVCNPALYSAGLYNAVAGPKYFLELFGAPHLPPYSEATNQWAPVVDAVTVAFFKAYVGGSSTAAELASMNAAARPASVAALQSKATAPVLPPASRTYACGQE